MSDEKTIEENDAQAQSAPDAAQEAASETSDAPRSIEEQLADSQAKCAAYLDGWQRARAELDNYRKRTARERAEWGDTLRSEFVLSVLPALDDFDLALANLPEDIAEHGWVNGVILAHRKLAAQVENLGVTEIEAAGKDFNPGLHEAVTHEPSKDHKPGEIIGVVRKGYKLGDKVIRPAMVRVAS